MKQPQSPPPGSPASDADTQPPPRSRNAKAQARHRAKRKAYIEQLEQTVSRLQAALSVPPEQLAVSHVRVHELEQENLRLRAEVDALKTQLGVAPADRGARRFSMPFGNSTADLPQPREGKRRRLSAESKPTVDHASYLNTHATTQDAPPPIRSIPMLPISPLAQATSAFPGVNASVSTTTPSLFGYPTGNSSTTSSSDSPYSITSSFSTLSDQLSAPPSLEGFRDSSDAMRLAQSQSQPQQLPSLGVYARRSPDASGYQPFQETRHLPTFDIPSEPDLSSWRGYPSYTRGP